jgi:hypothetical protein
MNRAWIELLVRDAAGTSTGGDFVVWAVQALVEGLDSAALRQLAGLAEPSRFEAKPLFDRAVRELSLALPATPDALLRAYLAVLAGDILTGTRQPAEALDLIHRHVLGPLNHPADLMEWCYLWEGLDPARSFASLSDAERDDAARALARKALKDGGPS